MNNQKGKECQNDIRIDPKVREEIKRRQGGSSNETKKNETTACY